MLQVCSVMDTVTTSRHHDNAEELVRLRARIEQQSELISLMKKRSDGLLGELDILYSNFAKAKEEKDDLVCQLSRKQQILEDKDKQWYSLTETCDTLTTTNRCLLQEIELLKSQVESLLKEKVKITDENKLIKQKVESLEVNLKLLQELNETMKNRKQELTTSIKSDLNETNLKYEKTLALNSLLQEQVNNLECQLTDTNRQMLKVQNEHVEECNNLQKKLTETKLEASNWRQKNNELEKKLLDTTSGYKLKIAALSVPETGIIDNLKKEMVQLQEKLTSVEKEFSSYKEHSMELLQHEKQLNSKLRHLAM